LVDINIIPDNGSLQNRYLGAKAKGRPPRTPTQGPDTVPVTLIEYGDYECPYCALWETVIEWGLGNKSAMGNILFFDDRRALFL
jgi:protein-disulfide isomerase